MVINDCVRMILNLVKEEFGFVDCFMGGKCLVGNNS